jgi:hypothetical protein
VLAQQARRAPAQAHAARVMRGATAAAHSGPMLHVRVVNPAEVTGQLVDKLTAAATRPGADVSRRRRR